MQCAVFHQQHCHGCAIQLRRQPPPRRKSASEFRLRVTSGRGHQHPRRRIQAPSVEHLEQRLKSLRDRAKVVPEAAGALDQIEQKIELLTWPAAVPDQSLDHPPEKPQAVRQQSALLKGARRRVATPPWMGGAIYAVAALAMAVSLKSGSMRSGDAGTVAAGVPQHAVQAETESRLERLLGHRRMPEAPEGELVPVLADGSVRMRRSAAKAFFLMQEAAYRDGVRLVPISGFRSVQEQQRLFYDVKAARVQRASERARVSAPPGFSEHHTGYALDIGDRDCPSSDMELEFQRTVAFAWLQRHAGRFHFEMSFPADNSQGIAYEPWHWRFVGDDHSLWTFYGQGQEQR